MLFLLLGEVHPLIFHQVPTSQMSNKFSTWSWNIHTHNTHLPMVCEKPLRGGGLNPRKYCLSKRATSQTWINHMKIPNLFESSPTKWILQLSFPSIFMILSWESPQESLILSKKRNRQPPGGLRKGSFKHGPPSFIGGVHPPFSSSPQVATCLLLALLEQNTCGESGEMWWVVVGWWLVLKL